MIEILNIKPGDVIEHSIAYVFGKCLDIVNKIKVIDADGKLISWQVKNCYFKVFVVLKDGENRIEFQTENGSLSFTIFYRPNSLKRSVRVLYVVCEDDLDNGSFQSPNPAENRISNAVKRISLSVKLLQTFISEYLFKIFGIRKTFRLFNDQSVCEVYKTKLKLNEALNLKQNELFISLANEIKSHRELFNENCKYIAMLSFTRFEPQAGSKDIFLNTKGFCALGSEWLAVYGTACLYTWCEELNDLQYSFQNDTLVDVEKFMNDSAFRDTYWACYATSLGSLLHEFSHILDLGHNQNGIMARGFDSLHSFVTIQFDDCKCYQNYKNKSTNNPLIDRVAKREKEFQENSKSFKQEIISATFKNSLTKEFIVISNLTWNIKSPTQLKIETNDGMKTCRCLMNCVYEDCNVNILFHHKWLNDYNNEIKGLFTFFRGKNYVQMSSANNLLLYEIRDKRANTIKYENFGNENQCKLHSISIDCINCSANSEIFLMDIYGNYLKYKL